LIRALLGVALLTACVTTVNEAPPATSAPSPTPYAYPDLPGEIEVTISEGDCEEIETVAIFMDRDSVDPDVRADAIEAIEHRAQELGCP